MGVAYAHITASLGSIAVAVIDIIVLRDMLNKGNKGLEIVEMLEILRRYLSRVVLSFLGGFLVLLYNCWGLDIGYTITIISFLSAPLI